MYRLLFFIIISFWGYATTAYSQKTKKVHGEYIYYAPENVSLEEAKLTALSRAQLQALADEFGTVVSQHNATLISNKNGKSNTDFTSLSSSDVKGEWIETIGSPEYEITYQQGMLVVKCSVNGRAREIVAKAANFMARVLRNGTDDRSESDNFKDGDNIFLSFQTSTDSYLAVYLIDASKNAFCLLPYRSSSDGKVKVEANSKYILFSQANAAPLCGPSEVDEYTLTCDNNSETNYIYIVNSPNPFVKAVDNAVDVNLPRELSLEDFEKWLAKNRVRDKDMQVDIKTITVTK